MQVKTFGCACDCMQVTTVTIELSVEKGNHRVISGLPDDSVKESLARIDAAVRHSGFFVPDSKLVYNLHPADLPKKGTLLDLPMAIAMLAASGQINAKKKISTYLLAGELSLDGSVQPVLEALNIALHGWKEGFEGILVPLANVQEAALVTKVPVYGIETLEQAVQFLNGEISIEPTQINTRELFYAGQLEFDTDFRDVKGQEYAKRAMEICAAGSHGAILIGPPGAGKSMIAQRLNTILPPLTLSEALDVTRIASVCNDNRVGKGLISKRPFVTSHYSTSIPGLIGGGSTPQPGMITKAHHGVLFMDELAEYSRPAIESIRLPMETGEVKISRAMKTVTFPASFILIAATNPCPCGYFNHPTRSCSCSPKSIQKYLNKLSAPLLDRLDLHIEVMAMAAAEIMGEELSEDSASIRQRVMKARDIQIKRFAELDHIHHNSQMNAGLIKIHCRLEADAAELLVSAMQHLQLSGRAHNRILKVARTIADLEGAETIRFIHISEAIGYRSLDKQSWMDKAKDKNTSLKKNLFKIA